MRVKKICAGKCKKLKSRLDFPIGDGYEGRGEICNACLEESGYVELNNKINKNNPFKITNMSLKEKRAAAAAAEAAKSAPKTETTKSVSKKSAPAPVEEKKAIKKSAPAPVEEKKAIKKSAPAETAKPVAKEETASKEEKVAKPKKVKLAISQYDLATGELIKKFDNVDLAAAAVGKHTKYIDINGKNGSVSAYGFKWLYEGYKMPVAGETAVAEPKAKKSKIEDKPVPGDLDFDPEAEEEATGEEEEEGEFEDEENEFEEEENEEDESEEEEEESEEE